jgi:hypothetical protein
MKFGVGTPTGNICHPLLAPLTGLDSTLGRAKDSHNDLVAAPSGVIPARVGACSRERSAHEESRI